MNTRFGSSGITPICSLTPNQPELLMGNNRAFSLASGNNIVSIAPTNLLSIAGNTTNSAATLKLYNGKVAGDIVAANLVHTFTLAQGAIAYGFDGLYFPAGLICVLTLNSATCDILIEHD
jgi:hypothetical protein